MNAIEKASRGMKGAKGYTVASTGVLGRYIEYRTFNPHTPATVQTAYAITTTTPPVLTQGPAGSTIVLNWT